MSGLRFLVIEGNTREARDALVAAGGHEPAVLYGDTLLALAPGATYDIIRPCDPGAALPVGADLQAYHGAVITGSALNVPKGGPAVEAQIAMARAVFASGIPFFGSCWGLQVATAAAGGVVRANPLGRELGIARKIAKTAEGVAHPLLADRPPVFEAVAIHGDEVETMPPDSVILAGNGISRVQAAEIRHDGGVFWGVQYHPEFSLAEIGAYCRRYGEIYVSQGFFTDLADVHALAADWEALTADPAAHKRLAFRYGADADVLDPAVRLTEIRAWIDRQVKPAAGGA